MNTPLVLQPFVPAWISRSIVFADRQDLTEAIGQIHVPFKITNSELYKTSTALDDGVKTLIEVARRIANGSNSLFADTLKDWKGSIEEYDGNHYVAFKPSK